MVPVVLLLFVGLVPCFQGADPVYSPQTLSDSAGNQADSSSKITWADLPSGQPYLVSNPSRVTAGLEPYYNLMHSFINSVFLKGFPDEIVEKAIDGEYTYVINNYSSYITNFLGFAICVAVGILFIVIFPIVGCCFCCCRLCGKCGGKRQQLQKDADNTCRKYTFISILFVSTTFVLVGSICIYINNNNMTTMLNSIPDITEDNLADIKTYTNNTVEEAKHIISTNFQFVKSALFRDLDNVAYLAGLPLKTNIKDSTNLGATLTSAYSLASSVDAIDASLTSVENNLTALETSINELDTALTAVKTNLDTIFTTCGGACGTTGKPNYNSVTLDIDSSTFPDLSSARTSMDTAKATNLTAKIVDAEKELNDIPNTVATEANSTINTMKTTINDLSDNLDGVLNQVTNINSMLSGSNATVDLEKYSNMVKDAKNTIEKYDKYRWYGGVALSSLTLLVVVFVVLGLVFGIFGTSVSTPTHQRGCVSNCGGTFLIASVALVFIFSSLLMLLTTVPFIPGAPIHKVLCEPITKLELLQKYLNMFEKKQVGEGKYWLAKMILSNDTIPLTFTGVLQDCKSGKSVFTAFKLDSKFDLTDMLNYSKTLNVQSEIDGVNVDLSSITVYPTSLQTQLNDVKDAVNINFSQFYTELGANVTTANLSALADELDTYAASGIPAAHEASLKAEATKLRNIEAAEYAYVKANVTALNTSLSEMETTVSSIPATVDALDSGLTAADNYIKNNASTVVKSILSSFANRLLGIIDSFIAFTDSAVKNQLGSCEPVWNIYNSLLVHTFCYNFMDCLNGFWFSIGWVVFFFLPSVIFSVKAAKYFRQTEMPSEDDSPPPYSDAEKYPQDFTSQHPMPSKAQFWMRNNKVGHKDSLEGW